jgi:putative component of toxin-antitoxin plasmid stabilization module
VDTQPLRIEIADAESFARGLKSLSKPDAIITRAAIEHLLAVEGLNLAREHWLKPLSKGLWEFRIGKTTTSVLSRIRSDIDVDLAHSRTLVRVFCAFTGDRVLLLLAVYDKSRDPSSTRQQLEINQARKILQNWKAGNA